MQEVSKLNSIKKHKLTGVALLLNYQIALLKFLEVDCLSVGFAHFCSYTNIGHTYILSYASVASLLYQKPKSCQMDGVPHHHMYVRTKGGLNVKHTTIYKSTFIWKGKLCSLSCFTLIQKVFYSLVIMF